jgi:hypothetical protein
VAVLPQEGAGGQRQRAARLAVGLPGQGVQDQVSLFEPLAQQGGAGHGRAGGHAEALGDLVKVASG